MPRGELLRLLTAQYERWWNIDVKRFKSKKQFLGYAGRYARRPPIAQHRFRTIGRQEIRFVTKDTRTKQSVETTYTPAEFLATLADHVPDRYRHTVRYFGLLAPRVKCQTHDTVWPGAAGEAQTAPMVDVTAEMLWRGPAGRPQRPANAVGSSRSTRRAELIRCRRARTPPPRSPNPQPPEI